MVHAAAATERFEARVYDRVVSIITAVGQRLVKWPDEMPYMMSLYVNDDCDDPRRPGVALAFEYPPEAHDLAEQPGLLEQWRNDGEGLWNYAALSQDLDNLVGHDYRNTDPEGAAMVDAMFQGLADEDCTDHFVGALIRVVQQVHRERLTEQHLTRSIPLLIHELEYYSQIATQNVAANGLDRAGSFADWIAANYSAEALRGFKRSIETAQHAYLQAMSASAPLDPRD